MAFMQNPTASSFDFNQLQNQQLNQQRMQNGNVRNGSPAYHNPMYQTQAVIPSKRPHPREDGIGASPQQHPGALPGSRSQTPQASYPGFPGAVNVNGGQQFPGTPTYQQFQQTGNHANQSPIMQSQVFNPQAPQQRVQTISPSPFSPATQTFVSQASPPQSEHGSRVNTPQNGAPHYTQGMSFAGVQGQPFTPPVSSTVDGAGLAQYNQHLQNQHQQQQQQLRLQDARVRQMQQQRQHGEAPNPMGQPSNQLSPHQIAAFRAQQAQQAQQRPNNPEQLLRTITQWAQQHGQHFNPQPVIAGRPISSVQLFMGVMKMGGSKRVNSMGQWPNVANFLHFSGPQQMAAAQELQSYWATNLAGYEHSFGLQQQQRRAMADPLRTPNHTAGGEMASRQDAFSPAKQMHIQSIQQPMQPPPSMQPHFHSPTKQMPPHPHDPRQPLQNGYLPPQQGQGQGRPPNIYSIPQLPMQAPPHAIPVAEITRAPIAKLKRSESSPYSNLWPKKKPFFERCLNYESNIEIQDGDTVRTWGGLELQPHGPFIETIDDLLKFKLSVPRSEELGLIDLRALTLSLRSGMHAEVRLALDALASLSKDHSSQTPLVLGKAGDLLESLIDCADDQVQFLADHSAEVSDEMLFASYEDTIRNCKIENVTLQDVPEFGTPEYDLDRAANRLICITTILRNLSSSSDVNHIALADPMVIRLMATVVRYIGTRSMMLRTHMNVLDFSKDILTILSNVSQHIDLPGREEALCILHFLLSFAPSPAPNSADDGEVTFSLFHAGTHRYYPQAIDSLAKLLARGDPNRTFYRLIFVSDTASPPPFDLLTRAFGLAIAALPGVANNNPGSLIKARLPHLIQGLLAAEILASMIPSTEHQLARSWLASPDGFAVSLMRIVIELGKQPPPQPAQRHHQGRVPDSDPLGYATITERGFAVLRKLTEKAKDIDGFSRELPYGVLPDKRTVVAALVLPNLPPDVARQLCALSLLDT